MKGKLRLFVNPTLFNAYQKQCQDIIEQIKRRTMVLKNLGQNPAVPIADEEADLMVAVADKILDALAILPKEPKERTW